MSHGQATRSTLTFSRVTHFIAVLLVLLFFPVLPARCIPSRAVTLCMPSHTRLPLPLRSSREAAAPDALAPRLAADCAQYASFPSAVRAPPPAAPRPRAASTRPGF